MLLIDAHEDLAWNMAAFGRDYTLSASETRRREAGTPIPALNDDTLLGYPEYRRGKVAVVVGSLFAAPARHRAGEWEKLAYEDTQQAHRLYTNQIDRYERLTDEHPACFRLLKTRPDLEAVIAAWEQAPDWLPTPAEERPEPQIPRPAPDGPPVGIVISMEGAEAIRQVGELEDWYARGVRGIGPAWVGTRFCGGTREPGPLTSEGFALLERMASLNLALDLTHMDEQAVLQALDAYPGPLLASHSNALALLPGAAGNRHLSDRVIRGMLERDGIIGVVGFNAFLKAGWRKGDQRAEVGLEQIVAQIDYICQMAGDAHHAAIGTDFDGGFGWQSVPHEIDTIADLQKLAPMLAEKGYTQDNIAAVLSGNWLGLLRRILPASL